MKHLNEFDEFDPKDFDDMMVDLEEMGFKKKFKYGEDFGFGPEMKKMYQVEDYQKDPAKYPVYMKTPMVLSLERFGVLGEPTDREELIFPVDSRMYGMYGYFGALWPDEDHPGLHKLTARRDGREPSYLRREDPMQGFLEELVKKSKESGKFEISL
jgi:hypothetical protein